MTMRITQIQLKNFRCFAHKIITFDQDIVLITGANGSGKTSLLEAVHYLCYLRSFKTHIPRELIHLNQDNFFIKADFSVSDMMHKHEIQVGLSGKKRLVKINQKVVKSYKELIDHFKVVTLTEDDLTLIKGGPSIRRSFIDQVILLYDPVFIATLKQCKSVVENRNSLLQSGKCTKESYELWTRQLWEKSHTIQVARKVALESLEREAHHIIQSYFDGQFSISFAYNPKRELYASFDAFLAVSRVLYGLEVRYGRSLFGAHLDDFTINFQDKKSRIFASRGQQKLIMLLIKIAQIKELAAKKGSPVFLLDDFMTDFDQERANTILTILSRLDSQLIFTSPLTTGFFEEALLKLGAHKMVLTH